MEVDGDILPRYSFQAQISITTNTSNPNTLKQATEEAQPKKVTSTKQVSRKPKPLKMHKARDRKVKVA